MVKRIVWDEPGRVGEWVCARLDKVFEPARHTVFGLESDGDLVAGVLYDKFNHRSIAANIAAEGAHWPTREFVRAILDYPFLQLKVSRVFGFIDSTNAKSQRFARHMGLSLVTVIEGAGDIEDLCVYCITSTNYKSRYI